jgi:hypothetical protein
MADDTKKRSARDRAKVAGGEFDEVVYWRKSTASAVMTRRR